ncbi:MAG: hypothetical protein ABL983_25245, partial [Nitrospira sp.]
SSKSGVHCVSVRKSHSDTWAKKAASALVAARVAQRAYVEQAFAMATLCGAILQVAAKGIECYSSNQAVPSSMQAVVGDSQSAKPFCIGRKVLDVPIGLIIFAGRNQHTHYNEPKLNKVNVAVFERLALHPEVATVKDPAFDLDNSLLESYASNITFILGWRSYDAYAADLNSLLET